MSEKESNNLRQKRSLAEKASEISQVQESIAGDDISDAGVDVGVDVGVGVGVDDDNEERFGWVVVVAAFFVQAIIVGTITNYGVYQDRYETHEYAAANSFQISLVGTLAVVGMNTLGLFTGQVADYLGYRISAFISGISMSVCLIATSFSTEIWQLYIFQGYLYGASASLAFFPSVSLPSQWFKRRRGFAMGIVVAGGGVGGLILSPVVDIHIETLLCNAAYARTHGVSVSTASLLIGILNGFSASGRVIMGIASDHIGDHILMAQVDWRV
ncbi:hypothetical protein BGZ76_005985 [Entomortierella beljakovae]|nr:hypothetical protein BGZ76_005985 [Entomortierella beljakovae]